MFCLLFSAPAPPAPAGSRDTQRDSAYQVRFRQVDKSQERIPKLALCGLLSSARVFFSLLLNSQCKTTRKRQAPKMWNDPLHVGLLGVTLHNTEPVPFTLFHQVYSLVWRSMPGL